MYAFVFALMVLSGLRFANRETEKGSSEKSTPKPLSAAERKAAMKRWEATPGGIRFKKWEASPVGKKVMANAAKLRQPLRNYTDMEAVVTSLSLPPGSRLGFGVMVRINNEDYILTLGLDKAGKSIEDFNKELELVHSLKVDDRIILKSHGVSYAPKYSYPIVAGDYVERNGKKIYKRTPPINDC